jgi:hypothetical protein
MLVWMAFVVTPIIFLIVVIVGIKGQGGLAMRLITIVVLVACVWGGINHAGKPKREAKQEAAHLIEKFEAAHSLVQFAAAQTTLSLVDMDNIVTTMNALKSSIPPKRHLPELHGIVVEEMTNSQSRIDLVRSQQFQESRFAEKGGLPPDVAQKFLEEAEKVDEMLKDSVKKLCSYMERPEKLLEQFKPGEMPKVCSTL